MQNLFAKILGWVGGFAGLIGVSNGAGKFSALLAAASPLILAYANHLSVQKKLDVPPAK